MKITVYYEDKRHPTVLDVPDEDCEIWVETDYQKRLAAVEDKSSVARRTPQQIMDEECNKPTFNSHQRETRRHVSLDALDVDDNYIPGAEDVMPDFSDEEYADLYDAIRKLKPQQQKLLKKVFWEEMKQIEIARSEGVYWTAIQNRLVRIYARLKKLLEE